MSFPFCIVCVLLEAGRAHVIEVGMSIHIGAFDAEFGLEESGFVLILCHCVI